MENLISVCNKLLVFHSSLCDVAVLQYAKYQEPRGIEAIRHVLQRACNIHLPKKPHVHFTWAAYEERHGKIITSVWSCGTVRAVDIHQRCDVFKRTSSFSIFCSGSCWPNLFVKSISFSIYSTRHCHCDVLLSLSQCASASIS